MTAKLTDKTIAVLPFINRSTSEDNEFFSDGITEEIINALAKIRHLKVTSRTSSFFFKGKNIPLPDIGRQLKVSTILEGSVRVSGNSLRISAQLIQVEEDFHFWSATWDRKLENVFEIQDEISLLIADKLREHFGHFEIQEHLVEQTTSNVDAYAHALRAKFYENKWNPAATKTAISYYEKALVLDENYVEAHLGLANCYSFLGTTGFLPFEEAWGKTITFTQQAKALGKPTSGLHYQLSNQAFFIDCDYGKSLQEMQKAIDCKPNNAEAHQFISFLYMLAGEREKASRHLEIALGINPMSEETHFFKAYFHYMIEEYATSLSLLKKCLQVNNKNIPAHSIMTLCLLKLERFDEVIHYFDTVPADVIIQGEKTGAIALAYALKKETEQAFFYYEKLKLEAKAPNGFTADSYLFLWHIATGNHDKAFDWVAQAIKNKASLLLVRYTDPLANAIKKEASYLTFKQKIFGKNPKSNSQKLKKTLLDDETAATFAQQLLRHIEKTSPHLNPNLSLRTLANEIDIHPNQLSWLLNTTIGQNYTDFINQYRIEAFKSLAKNPKNTHFTIEGLAYESGFKSKTVFNTYFKKSEGLTPKQFLKSLKV